MNKNGVALAELARKHGIPRADFVKLLKNEKEFVNFIWGLNPSNEKWFNGLKVNAEKKGYRVHLIPYLMVDYSKPLLKTIMLAGPDSNPEHNHIRHVDEHHYHYELEKIVKVETIVLLNVFKGVKDNNNEEARLNKGNYYKVLNFRNENILDNITPHALFALGIKHPKLNDELGVEYAYAVETQGVLSCHVGEYDINYAVLVNKHRREVTLVYKEQSMNYPGMWFALKRGK